MSTRADDITKLLNEIVEPVRKLNLLLTQDRVSYELIRGDTEALLMQKRKALEELDSIKAENERSKSMGNSIIDVAKEKADEIIGSANTKMAEAIKMVEQAQEYVKGIDKAYHEKLMTRLDMRFKKAIEK